MRLRTLFILVGLSLALLMIISLYIEGPNDLDPSSGNGAVKVYFADNISPAHLTVIALFNERNAGSIEVVPVDLPFEKFSTNERKELLARSLRSKSDKLDVFAVDRIWVPRFARWAEPLTNYLPRDIENRIVGAALPSCEVNDTLVAIPMYIDIGLMYYRRDILSRLPDAIAVEKQIQRSMSWDEMVELGRRLGYSGKPFYVYQAKDYEGLVCNFLEMARSEDPKFLRDSSFDLQSPGAVRAVEKLAGFVRRHISPKEVTQFDENMSYQYFLDHDALFVRGWPNFLENFRTFYADSAKLANIGRAPLPHERGSEPSSVFGGWNLMISQTSTKKKEAAQFIEFLQSTEVQRLLFEKGGYIPVNAEVYADSVFLTAHPELAFYRRLMEKGFHRPALIDYTRTSDVVSHFVRRAILDQLTAEEALRRADDMITSNAVLIR